ncbi:MAG: hypothetical protein FWE23_10360 [Chitinivibrionia bacterium]|nr:hypothetical protein [Chitinivibrionia bacterium]
MYNQLKSIAIVFVIFVVSAFGQTIANMAATDGEIITLFRTDNPSVIRVPANATVTIVSNEGADLGSFRGRTLDIGANAVVIWKARITSNTSTTVLTITGAGTFELHDEARISQIVHNTDMTSGSANVINSTGNSNIIIYGGSISTIGTGFAINSPSGNNIIAINGGFINRPINANGLIIYHGEKQHRDWLTVNFQAVDGEIITINRSGALGTLTVPANATVTIVTDGENPISRTAPLNLNIGANARVIWKARTTTSSTINAVSLGASTGTFEVHEGAIIKATAGQAITGNNAIINITGGIIAAQGTTIVGNNNVLSHAPTSQTGGLVVSYPASGSFMPGSRTDLISLPADANISWGVQGGRNGIFYNETQFLATSGTQQISETVNWAGITVTDGQVVRVSAASTGTLSVVAGATVTIISDGEQPIARTAALNLTIGEGATVNWEAKVAASGTTNAVNLGTGTGTIDVRDGAIIIAETGQAIAGSGAINISGGLVAAQGTSIVSGVLSRMPTNQSGGLVVAYPTNRFILQGDRPRCGLTSLPENADIWWTTNGGRIGIQYNETELFATTGTQHFWTGTINTAANLAAFRDFVNAGNSFSGDTIRLGANISLSGTWTPIGNTSTNSFRGIFDGTGRTISGASAPLFGNASGQIRNLTLNSSRGLVENYGGTIENVRVNTSGSIGLIGTAGGVTIRNSSVSGNMSPSVSNVSVNLGGLVNNANGSVTIENSTVTANITANSSVGSIVGGLVGRATQSVTIRNSSVSGDIRSSVSGTTNTAVALAGGLIGQANTSIDISESYFIGEVLTTLSSTATTAGLNHTARSGGFIGYGAGILGVGSVNINNSFVLGDVLASNASTGATSGSTFSGGFIGTLRNRIDIENSYINGTIMASGNQRNVGGIVGYWSASRIESVFSATPCPLFGVEGTSAAQLRNRATFTGWDFESVWDISSETNNGFPFLRNVGANDNNGGTFIRPRPDTQPRLHGILLENSVVSDVAKISIITPEPAQITLRILDALGNVVWTATDVGATALGRPNNISYDTGDRGRSPLQTSIVWNLTNQSGRYVASGTYLIIVEAVGQSGRRFVYSSRVGVSR